MLITLRLPRSSALKLNLPVDDVKGQEVVATLTAVELAGRLTLGTGKAISPEAVVRYCVAWQAATITLHRLVEKHGEVRLAEMLREEWGDRALWVPETNRATLEWFRYLLEAHFLSSGVVCATTPEDVCPFADGPPAQHLAEICERNFALAYHLWVAAHLPG